MAEEGIPGDASTLIYLAKADAFSVVSGVVLPIVVPSAVWNEAVEEGERISAPDVPRIREAHEETLLRRVELTSEEQALAGSIATEHRLGLGESEVLALATRQGRALVDEGRASRVAHALGIVPISTLFLPILGRRSGALDSTDAVRLLRRLAVVTGARADVVMALESYLRKEVR